MEPTISPEPTLEGMDPLTEPLPEPLPEPVEEVSTDALPEATEPNWKLAGEALAAVTGLFPDKPITPEQGQVAEGLILEIQKAVTKFCKFGEFEKFKMQPSVDFEEVYGKLQPVSDAESALAASDLKSLELIEAWEATVNNARAYLRKLWPVIIRQTPTGPEWIEPSRTAGGQASALLMVLGKPMNLLTEMNRGTATPSMFGAVKAAFPELYDRMTGVFSMALAEAGAKGRRCPWGHELQLRLLFNLPPSGLVTFGTEQGQKPQTSSKIDIDFTGMQTKNQQVE